MGGAVPESAKEPRLHSLTSLRWFAATAVFLRHADLGFRLGVQGATGVSFFFILSGFVLSWSSPPRPEAPTFWKRRFERIYADYLVVTVLAIPVLVGIGAISSVRSFVLAIFPLTLLQSWIPASQVYFGGNGVSWSLSDEAFFYAMFPLVFAGIRRLGDTGLRRFIVGLAALAIAIPVVVHTTSVNHGFWFWFIYINPAVRILEFGIGVGLALLVQRKNLPRMPFMPAVVLVVAGYVAAGWVPVYGMWVATTLVPFSLLIVAAAQADLAGTTSRLLASSTMIRLGQWSFAFYLVHQLVLRANDYLSPPVDRGIQILTCYLIATALAFVAFHFVEAPSQRWLRHRLSTSLG